jgi:hypothetical protein
MSTIQRGQTVKDTLTGFQGVITQTIEHMSGNIQYAVQPPIKEAGVMPDAIYLDAHTLEVIDSAFVKKVTPAVKCDIKVGQKVLDKATGVIGIAVSKSIYFNGCVSFLVLPPVNDKSLTGESPGGNWVSAVRLEVVDDGLVKVAKPASQAKPGGPASRAPAARAQRCA